MSAWWSHNNDCLPKDVDMDVVEDATGCIPLLLFAFLKSQDGLHKIGWSEFWNAPEVLNVKKQLFDFSMAKKNIWDE